MVHGRDLEPRIVGLVYNVAAAGFMVIKCHCGSRDNPKMITSKSLHTTVRLVGVGNRA